MKNIQTSLCLLIATAIFSPATFSAEGDTGFYAVNNNGDITELTSDSESVLISDDEVREAQTNREPYRSISEEEAKFLKERSKKKVKSEEY